MRENDLYSERERTPNLTSVYSKNIEPIIAPLKIYRNELCPCGSGKKYKKCCLK